MEEQRMKNPKMNKRNKLPLLLGILLLISAAAYGTRAYFTDSATEQAGIELKLGNVAVKSESRDWKYNGKGEAKVQKTTDSSGNKKVSYTNVSSEDSFTKKFIFKNTGSLSATIMLDQQSIVSNFNGTNGGKVYVYQEGPYDIKITSENVSFEDFIKGIDLKPNKQLNFEMEISLASDLDNKKYNDNGKNNDTLGQVALDLLEKSVTVKASELSEK